MTTQEFSNMFDTLVSSYSNGISFDDYEKSVFLTKAQHNLVVSLYNGKNIAGDTFENTEEVRTYLSPLIYHKTKVDAYNTVNKINSISHIYKLEQNVLFIIYESVDWDKKDVGCISNSNITVQPITHDEYHKIKKNPFRGANDKRVLRLNVQSGQGPEQYVELISKYPISSYTYRYIREPAAIIINDLDPLTTIEGGYKRLECMLHPSLHHTILEEAVKLALTSRGITTNNNKNA